MNTAAEVYATHEGIFIREPSLKKAHIIWLLRITEI